ERFRRQNEDIAAKYAVVDDMLLSQALADLAPEESGFIASARVALITARFSAFDRLKHQIISRHLPRRAHSIALLPEVDLLAAATGSGRRIYALRPSRSGYRLDRVDEIEEHYYALMTDPATARKDTDYQLKIHADAVNAPVMKTSAEAGAILIENLIKRHKQRLMDQLQQFGYEETNWEKTQKILLSLIPLYDCISGIREERREAVISCMIDAFTLAPLAGQGAAIGARFAQRGALGGMVALRASLGALAVRASFRETLSRGGVDLIRFAVVPAARELDRQAMISLGLAAVRAMDPGFELAGIAGARAVKQLVGVAGLLENRVPVWRKIRVWLEQRHPPAGATPHATPVITARLAGLDRDLPVVKLGGDKLGAQDIYLRFNPETGEAFGKRYTLAAGNVLQAVPAPLAQRLRNILEQGLGGRGAPGAGKQLAGKPGRKPYTRVTGAHLRAWVQNGIRPHPTAMGAFIALRGIPLHQWRRYVHQEGTLTARGRALLASDEPDSLTRNANPPPEVQQRIQVHIDPGTWHDNIGRALPPAIIEDAGRASLREPAALRLKITNNDFFDLWELWASHGLLDEGRSAALHRLEFCLLNGHTQLDLSGLGLRDLPAAYPPRVVKLNLSNNRLQTIQGALPPDLMHLDISHNLFTGLLGASGDKLTVIVAHHNQLEHLPARLSASLAELDVSYNGIGSVAVFSHARLTTLNLNHNRLTQLPSFGQLKLKSLYLNHNQLEVLPDLPDTLSILSAAHNLLQEMTWLIPEKLTYLDLSSNLMNRIPPSWQFSKLRHLKLDNNLIGDILQPLPQLLISFSASNNQIMRLPRNWPSKITSIMLKNNDITSMSVAVFPPGLRVLNLNQNHIEFLSEILPAGIKKIFIADNKLRALMVNVPRDLVLIDVSHNLITERPAHLSAAVEFINTP
ncbi:hypothetical protein GRH90_02250, partial [Enterobacteriales bacterium SAP-6]|nr:hypothetical protein [Acerihabitans arboris]